MREKYLTQLSKIETTIYKLEQRICHIYDMLHTAGIIKQRKDIRCDGGDRINVDDYLHHFMANQQVLDHHIDILKLTKEAMLLRTYLGVEVIQTPEIPSTTKIVKFTNKPQSRRKLK